MSCILAIDQSTSATKALLFDETGGVIDHAAKPHEQLYPRPGWVEHDAEEIWRNTLFVARELVARHPALAAEIVCVSLSNQRETFVAFERSTGRPLHRAIVWQCRRGDGNCAEQVRAGRAEAIRAKTGLRVDSYFSAPKMQWLVRNAPEIARKLADGSALLGTIDTYLVHRLTGGAVFATDHTNASRTLLFDVGSLGWDDQLCDGWSVPRRALAEIRPSSARFGETNVGGALPRPVPVCGVMGDSQASLFAQRCFEPGSAKASFGSGTSILLNVGGRRPAAERGSVCTVGWVHAGEPTYALEGIITFSAATLTWLRERLGVFERDDQIESMAAALPDNGGVYLVPAFSGLGAPHWRDDARAAVVGLTAHSDRRHVVRAGLEAIAYQLRDALGMMEGDANVSLRRLHGDGGATASRFLMQFTADMAGVELRVARSPHCSPLGAAMMGMLGTGLRNSIGELSRLPRDDVVYSPANADDRIRSAYAGWRNAVAQVLAGSRTAR